MAKPTVYDPTSKISFKYKTSPSQNLNIAFLLAFLPELHYYQLAVPYLICHDNHSFHFKLIIAAKVTP